jgi:hypothetical protein
MIDLVVELMKTLDHGDISCLPVKGKRRWYGKETKGNKKENENVFNILP